MTTDIVHRLGELMNRRAVLRRVAASAASALGIQQLLAGPVLALYQCRCCNVIKPCQPWAERTGLGPQAALT
jgi:hypothetical protein